MPASLAWKPPIIQTVATVGQGVVEVAEAVEQHLAYLYHLANGSGASANTCATSWLPASSSCCWTGW